MLVLAIGVPYMGYLINGEMPFIKDPRGMSAVGLVLGTIAYLVRRAANARDRVGRAEDYAALLAGARPHGFGGARLTLAWAAKGPRGPAWLSVPAVPPGARVTG